ncbi:hypothetical protein QE152_g40162 [Popillia japonica]|uniref:Uncharacterized protein n=1 Tax=Popillia japonica TaxID=7064 RepID=A0AAW1HRU4_POPJA
MRLPIYIGEEAESAATSGECSRKRHSTFGGCQFISVRRRRVQRPLANAAVSVTALSVDVYIRVPAMSAQKKTKLVVSYATLANSAVHNSNTIDPKIETLWTEYIFIALYINCATKLVATTIQQNVSS